MSVTKVYDLQYERERRTPKPKSRVQKVDELADAILKAMGLSFVKGETRRVDLHVPPV